MYVSTPSERLQAMDDFQIVRFFQGWANDLCSAVTDPRGRSQRDSHNR